MGDYSVKLFLYVSKLIEFTYIFGVSHTCNLLRAKCAFINNFHGFYSFFLTCGNSLSYIYTYINFVRLKLLLYTEGVITDCLYNTIKMYMYDRCFYMAVVWTSKYPHKSYLVLLVFFSPSNIMLTLYVNFCLCNKIHMRHCMRHVHIYWRMIMWVGWVMV